MTFLSETNQDAYSVTPDVAASGPLVGFFDSFNAAMEAQMRTSSQFGVEYYMQELDWQQTQAMIEAGVENPPQLILQIEGQEPGNENRLWGNSVSQLVREDSGYYEDFVPERSRPYWDAARMYAGQDVDQQIARRVQEYDARVAAIREQYPNLSLRTSQEMFESVRDNAVSAEALEQTQRRTWGGSFGGFFGGALASLHPGTDPLNFYTLGIGGAGKTAMQRIMFQTGAQGMVETVNQVTGVQAERDVLGLSTGFGDAASRVAATAIGAGALQGIGELVGAGVKRWFRSTPDDPAPSPEVLALPPPRLELASPERLVEEARAARMQADPTRHVDYLAAQAPLSGIRVGTRRTVADIIDISRQMDSWDAGPIASMVPRTADAVFPRAVTGRSNVDVSAALSNNSEYQAAKAADPEAFDRFEKITERKAVLRRWIDELAGTRDEGVTRTVDNIDTRLHALEARLRTTQGKNAKAKIRNEIKQTQADRAELLRLSETKETPDIAYVRKDIVKLDEQMRDIAPLIGRAYAKADQKWGNTAEELDAVWDAYRKGRTDVDMPASEPTMTYDAALALTDRAPILQRADTVEPGATAADTATAILANDLKALDDQLTLFRKEIMQAFAKTADGKLRVGDHEFDLNDKMFMTNPDGTGSREVSVREMIAENRDAEFKLEAITSCSIPQRS